MTLTKGRAARVGALTLLLLTAHAVADPRSAAADLPTSAGKPLAPAAARPAAKGARATKLAKSGEAKFLAEDYEGALADFTAAEEAAPNVAHQWFIGHSQDHLAHYRAALDAYAKLLDADAAHLDPKVAAKLPEARERVAAIKAMPGSVRIDAMPASASLSIDGVDQPGTAPFDLTLAPGAHSLRFSAPGFEAETTDVDIAFASKRTLCIALHEAPPPVPPSVAQAPVAVAAPPPDAPPPPAISRRALGWAASGLAVVGAGLGTAFGIVALTANSSYTDHPTLGRAYRASDFAVYSDVSFGGAVALGASGLVLLLGGNAPAATAPPASTTRAPAPPASTAAASWTVQAVPIGVPHGAGAGAVVHF